MSSGAGTRFLYVTRLPPSPSGVAAYAETFADVLRALGDVELVRLPAEPARSQSSVRALRLAVALDRAVARDPGRVVHVELAGRGVAEFWAAWALARLRGRRVWLTVHDVPELSGGAFFTSLLDRRGGRRVAATLSRTVGAAAERSLLSRAEQVLCLSAAGARALEHRHGAGVRARAVPHVARLGDAPARGRREVFVPGYVASADDVLPLVRAVGDLPVGWTLTVGACAPDEHERLAREARRIGVDDRVLLLGYSSERELTRAFDRAAVVVRWRRGGWARADEAGAHAVSGPLVAALARGCAVVTNDSRGLVEVFDEAGVLAVGDGRTGAGDLVRDVLRLVGDEDERVARAEAGRALARRAHTVAAVAAAVGGGSVPVPGCAPAVPGQIGVPGQVGGG
ncbi:glycosyltransferase [Cellulomonas sp. P22]|uniref:glycosyltransferase family protein n=1 Tax=Cellulomonas sp. P22 TaxID=3373189 RepID=UPI00378B17C6